LIERSGQRIGFVWFETRVDESTAFGWDIYLEPEFRSQGVGRHVLQLCAEMLFLKGIRTVKLCVYEHNQVARSLYQSLGFEVEKFDQERRQYTLRRSAAHARA
jgi:ribosomal protein S18 acetylase RimI-like enzyme